MTELGITSEVGKLRKAIVHRPGIEISRLTPDNKEALLFDDLLWLDRAQQEHDEFVGILRSHGCQVLYFEDLLAEAIKDPAVRSELLDEVVSPAEIGPRVAEQLRPALEEAPVERVVEVLIGGLLESDLEVWGIGHLFADLIADRFHYVMRPLPNLIFMRDNSAWVGAGLIFSILAFPARARESVYLRTIYRHHPLFTGTGFPVWYGRRNVDHYPATIEGGDVLVLNSETLVVGLGERTAPASVEIMSRRLFAESTFHRVIVVHLRQSRAVMHLDTVFTMVDHNKFNVFPGLFESVDVHVLTPGRSRPIDVEPADDLAAALRTALDRDDLVMIPTGGDAIGRLREQWDDGNNTLALGPGEVVAYRRNQETNRRLRDAGVEVLELDAAELCRGRGGSRCLTQPLLRDEIGR